MATYEFIIKNQTSKRNGRSAVAGNSKKSSAPKQTKEDKQFLSEEQTKAASMIAIAAVGARFVVNEATYYVSTVGLRTGDTILQQKADYAWQVGSFALKTGAMLGVGLATSNPLLIIAGVGTIVNRAQEINQKQRTIDTQANIEQESIYRNNLRAGTKGSRSKWE